jgi:hypothetical protein
MAQRREHVSVSSIHRIDVRAQVRGSNDASLSVRYINPNNPSESRMFGPIERFEAVMNFDERVAPHGLIFVATRGDDQADAALVVELTDLDNGSVVFPRGGQDSETPFNGEPAILDLRLISF